MYDVIIVGAGPAGLTAAIYLGRALKKVLVLEAKSYGGQIINTVNIENYPSQMHISGYDLATNMYNQAKELGAEIIFEKVIDINNCNDHKKVITEKNEYSAKAIILATGADSRKLGLKNEDEFLGKGISYCATCDGAFYKNKTVAVNGGGNTAIEEALYLSSLAKKVYVIHRRNEFKAEKVLVNNLSKKDNVEIIFNSNVTKLNGNESLESIEITNNDNEVNILDVSALFVAVGHIPENQNFAKLINLDERGYVIANEDCKTNIEGIYVAGDNRVKMLRQLVTATADGAVAATNAINYINKNN